LRWVRLKFGPDVVWGIEDCRQVATGLERDLLTAGQRVVRVLTKLMIGARSVDAHPGQVRSD
jgi:transposase